MESARVTANGIEFAYHEWGDGDRLALCLHGFPDDAGTFDTLAPRLADAGFTVVAPFMRGYGSTGPAPDGDYSASALGRDALALADALGGDLDLVDPIVVGHDWGAVAAYAAATIDPEAFTHLVGMAVPPGFPTNALGHPRQWLRSWYMGFFQLPDLPERALRAEGFALVELLWGLWSPTWDYPEARIESVRETFRTPGTVAAALAYYRQLARGLVARNPFADRDGSGIEVPGLVVAGADDGCIGSELFADVDDAFAADSRAVAVRGAGHFVHRERPAVVAEEVTSFVGR
ncbi:alpha/beta fold hydrolase [Halococcus hamelinensis]|uniref:Alpha/beta hydrolase fold protein n=1 Tax=Halococcus hamelinensis 100A6 TaxID=1132509 RepID=M0MA91_9EURY|nr:alpha/beta hydrolase [Halococcus hamelinensis]EMA41519.1 alpha/beta hydrolase fold protein [Halococcus hamelinensis 100A6]